MSGFRSHYDVLGVARTASSDVIRAAYRVLSQKYHPDRHQGHPDYHAMMIKINHAYVVLSNPKKRHEYDVWLARQQLQAQVSSHHRIQEYSPAISHAQKNTAVMLLSDEGTPSHVKWWLCILLVAVVAVMAGVWWKVGHMHATVSSAIVAVSHAPNGQAFPIRSAYVSGYPILSTHGGNVIHVDNSSLNTAVFAQLFEWRQNHLTAVRTFYILPGDRFSVDKIGDGDFSLHYQRVDNGLWQVSDEIQIRYTKRSREYRNIDIHL